MNKKLTLKIQKGELTEHVIYRKLAEIVKDKSHSELLRRISQEEIEHYGVFKELTGVECQPDRVRVFLYTFIARFFGLNFGLKLMEAGEDLAQDKYKDLVGLSPKVASVIRDEEDHEKALIGLIDEDSLKYISSMVLGLNDALVELTAALAGFTLALQDNRLIGVVGLITGIAASMSMAASEYLSTKQEETDKDPLKASVYTGVAYMCTVILLVSPYFLFKSIFLSLGLVAATALFIILVFTFYISVAKGLDFKKRFMEMAALSLSIASATFFIGLAVRKIFGVEV